MIKILQLAESNIDSIVIGISPSLLAFRRNVMEKVSPESMAEDTEEVIRVRKKGYRAIIDPLVISEEEIPNDFKLRRKQKDRRAEGIIRALLINKDMLFNPKYGKYGFIVLPFELFLLVISPFLLFSLIIIILYILFLHNLLLGIIILNGIVIVGIVKHRFISTIIDINISGLIATQIN